MENVNGGAYYGEPYLRRLHKFGYPTNEAKRKDFNIKFYNENNLKEAERSVAINVISALNKSIQRRSVPMWIRATPELKAIYEEICKDYHAHFDSTKPRMTPKLYNIQPLNFLLPLKGSPMSSDSTFSSADETVDQKNSTELMQKKIEKLKREVEEKDKLIKEWKIKFEAEQEKREVDLKNFEEMMKDVAKISEELKEVKLLVDTLREKIELKDMLIVDKERTIQILSRGQ